MKMTAFSFKKMLSSFGALAIFALAVTLIACDKDIPDAQEEILTPTELNFKGVSFDLVDGRLVFSSLEDVQQIEQALWETPEAGDWFDQLPGFTNSREAYLAVDEYALSDNNGDVSAFSAVALLVEKDGDQYLEPVIDDVAARYLTNQDGIVQVGNEIYQILRDHALVVDKDKFFNAISTEDLMDDREVRTIPILRKEVSSDGRVNVAVCKGDYENKRRVRGELEERSSPFSSNVNCIARTKHFRRGAFGIYYGEKADQLSQFGCLTVNGNTSICIVVDKSLSNRQEISNTFFSGSDATITGSNTVRHHAREGSIDGECFTQPCC